MSLTNMGKIFVLVMIALLLSGLNTKSNLLHLFNAFLICLWLLSPIIAQKNSKDISVSIETPEEIFTGQSCPTQFFIENKSIYHKYAINVYDRNHEKTFCIPHLPPHSKSVFTIDTTYSHRGIIEWDKVSFNTRYPFNFFQYKFELPVKHRLYVLPRPFPVLSLPLEIAPKSTFENNKYNSDNKNSNDDFATLREYVPGDNPRNIDWKATAKRDYLITKEFTELLPLSTCIAMGFVLDSYTNDDISTTFELTVYSTASLVWNICQRGVLEKFQINEDCIDKGKGISHAKKVLRLLAEKKLQDIPVSFSNHENIIVITNRITKTMKEQIDEHSGKITIIYTQKPEKTWENLQQYFVYIKKNNIRLEKLC